MVGPPDRIRRPALRHLRSPARGQERGRGEGGDRPADPRHRPRRRARARPEGGEEPHGGRGGWARSGSCCSRPGIIRAARAARAGATRPSSSKSCSPSASRSRRAGVAAAQAAKGRRRRRWPCRARPDRAHLPPPRTCPRHLRQAEPPARAGPGSLDRNGCRLDARRGRRPGEPAPGTERDGLHRASVARPLLARRDITASIRPIEATATSERPSRRAERHSPLAATLSVAAQPAGCPRKRRRDP